MDMNERFVFAIDSKRGEAHWAHYPHFKWHKMADRNDPKPWLIAELLQEQLRNLKLDENDLTAEEIVANIVKGIQNEL